MWIRRSSYVFGGLLALALAAFWPRYLGRPLAGIDRYTHAHAALALLWVLLLIVQPAAISAGRRRLHRVLGRTSYAIVPAFLIASLLLAHFRFASMDADTFSAEARFLYLPLAAIVNFAICYAAAIRQRRLAPVHGRLMAATALTLIDPVLGRVLFFYFPPLPVALYQVITFGLATLLAAILLLSYRGETGGRRALMQVLAILVVVHLCWFVVPGTTAWLALASWFRELPLT